MSDFYNIFDRFQAGKKPEGISESQTQLSLWDTEAIEAGYQLLADLKIHEATVKFETAFRDGIGDRKELENAIACCRFWTEKLETLVSADHELAGAMADFLESYQDYPFTALLSKFRKKLLPAVTIRYQTVIARFSDLATNAAELLFQNGDFISALPVLEESLSHTPGDTGLQYILAQAYWHSGDLDKANEIYFDQFFHHPDQIDPERMENKKLQKLVNEFGVHMALAYGTIYEVITIHHIPDDIDVTDEDHRIGMECLRHIRASRNALRARDQKTDIHHRKQLHALSPEVCKAYIKSLRKSKGL